MTIYSLDQKALKKGTTLLMTKGGAAIIHGEVAAPEDFPDGHYAEITLHGEKTIVEVFHNDITIEDGAGDSPARIVKTPFYWIDPDRPERAAPLLQSLNPVDLGPYDRIISDPEHKAIYTALLGVSPTTPDSLVMVRAIHWIKKRGCFKTSDPKLIARQALSAVAKAIADERKNHDQQMQDIMQYLPKY